MKKLFYLAAALTTATFAQAQNTEKKVVKAGDIVANAISENGAFRFRQFTEGNFRLKDGTKNSARFNYHYISGEMLYLNTKGDTLALAIPEQVEYIAIGESKFIYENRAFHEVLLTTPSASLAKKIKIHIENEKTGGYGSSAPSSSQDQLRNVNYSSNFYQLSYDVAILKTTSFYWIDTKNNLQPATKKNALKMVAKDKQPKLEAFIEENKTNFNREDDLRKLLNFASSL
jgi:hypothetical protein